ncbi:MAG: ACT domain-containing protein [Gammaproteobacteria bacterium]|nr:ACT domain-containing protein [Gammaproteobacteria bacterium]MDH5629334.1 ACT domain-containing protein [Gammaproteobacteria bacterium]
MALKLKLLPEQYSIYQLELLPDDSLLDMLSQCSFYNITKTDEEISLVCPSDIKLKSIANNDEWRIFKIDQVLDFTEIGIIAKISKVLAAAKISIFVISTFHTDYFMVNETSLNKTLGELSNNGYEMID